MVREGAGRNQTRKYAKRDLQKTTFSRRDGAIDIPSAVGGYGWGTGWEHSQNDNSKQYP